MNRKHAPLIAAAVVVFLGLSAFVTVAIMSHQDPPEFGNGTYVQIEDALTSAGFDVSGGDVGPADITGGYEKASYDATAPDGDALVIVRAFTGPKQLDAIGADTYTGDSVLGFRWMQFTISVTASTPPPAIDRFRVAMDKLGGAKQIYDRL